MEKAPLENSYDKGFDYPPALDDQFKLLFNKVFGMEEIGEDELKIRQNYLEKAHKIYIDLLREYPGKELTRDQQEKLIVQAMNQLDEEIKAEFEKQDIESSKYKLEDVPEEFLPDDFKPSKRLN